jgi:hypothetical protein
MDEPRIKANEKILESMLLTLAAGGYVTLTPEPPKKLEGDGPQPQPSPPPYQAVLATPTPALDRLLVFRGVHPLYGAFLIDQFGLADENERLQAMESVLEMPRPLLRYVRPPRMEDMPPGPLARERLDPELIQRGLVNAHVLEPKDEEEEEVPFDQREYPPTLAEKLRLYFDALYPEVSDLHTSSVWAAGELLRFNGNFNLYVKARDLIKQEGVVFRHLLRLILLCGEFAQAAPADATGTSWQWWLRDLSDRLTASCRVVDPGSTDEIIQQAHAADVVEGEAHLQSSPGLSAPEK